MEFSTGMYFFDVMGVKASYSAAEKICAQIGGTLPVIRTDEDRQKICDDGIQTWLDVQLRV